jgi:hypothetical protein
MTAAQGGSRSRRLRRIDRLLLELERHLDTLMAATERFGADFEESRFVAAATSRDPRARVDADAVERGHDKLVNLQLDILDTALAEAREGGLLESNEGSTGRWAQAAALGVPEGALDTLRTGAELRNRLQHAYPDVDPAEIHAGVQALLERFPSLIRALRVVVDRLEG